MCRSPISAIYWSLRMRLSMHRNPWILINEGIWNLNDAESEIQDRFAHGCNVDFSQCEVDHMVPRKLSNLVSS
uniref:Uncharacterized protein n=1 Tax=Rhizophora mucronata TaxID=61149 RepID=A0A2P2IJR3_RHIMU